MHQRVDFVSRGRKALAQARSYFPGWIAAALICCLAVWGARAANGPLHCFHPGAFVAR